MHVKINRQICVRHSRGRRVGGLKNVYLINYCEPQFLGLVFKSELRSRQRSILTVTLRLVSIFVPESFFEVIIVKMSTV